MLCMVHYIVTCMDIRFPDEAFVDIPEVTDGN